MLVAKKTDWEGKPQTLPRAKIIDLKPMQLVGFVTAMTLNQGKTQEVWEAFMRRREGDALPLNRDVIVLNHYANYTRRFADDTPFDQWVTVEVSPNPNQASPTLPAGMQAYPLQGGKYARFNNRGSASDVQDLIEAILNNWFPQSGYKLANRPHFQMFPAGYRQGDPETLPTIWLPIDSFLWQG